MSESTPRLWLCIVQQVTWLPSREVGVPCCRSRWGHAAGHGRHASQALPCHVMELPLKVLHLGWGDAWHSCHGVRHGPAHARHHACRTTVTAGPSMCAETGRSRSQQHPPQQHALALEAASSVLQPAACCSQQPAASSLQPAAVCMHEQQQHRDAQAGNRRLSSSGNMLLSPTWHERHPLWEVGHLLAAWRGHGHPWLLPHVLLLPRKQHVGKVEAPWACTACSILLLLQGGRLGLGSKARGSGLLLRAVGPRRGLGAAQAAERVVDGDSGGAGRRRLCCRWRRLVVLLQRRRACRRVSACERRQDVPCCSWRHLLLLLLLQCRVACTLC